MKNRFIVPLTLIIIAASLVYASGCTFIKRAPATSGSSGAVSSTEPLTGSWNMSRVSIAPDPPSQVPGFIIDQIIPKNTTWKISSSGGQLKIVYGGKSTWFNSLGISVNLKPVMANESSDNNSCVFSGGGSVSMGELPAALSFLGSFSNISMSYTDKINVTLSSQDKISAVITYSATGSFTGPDGPDSIDYQGTITYTGTRK